MMRPSYVLAALVGLIAFASPAAGGIGGIVQPADLIDTFDRTCGAGAPNFARTIPAKATAERWDALQRRGNGTARGWMMSLGGSPIIIDIDTAAPGRCSTSAASDPRIIKQALQRHFGRAPDYERTEGNLYVTAWRVRSGGVPRTVSVSTVPGSMLARINMRLGA